MNYDSAKMNTDESPAVHVQLEYFEPTPLHRELELRDSVNALQRGLVKSFMMTPTCIFADSKYGQYDMVGYTNDSRRENLATCFCLYSNLTADRRENILCHV